MVIENIGFHSPFLQPYSLDDFHLYNQFYGTNGFDSGHRSINIQSIQVLSRRKDCNTGLNGITYIVGYRVKYRISIGGKCTKSIRIGILIQFLEKYQYRIAVDFLGIVSISGWDNARLAPTWQPPKSKKKSSKIIDFLEYDEFRLSSVIMIGNSHPSEGSGIRSFFSSMS